jgi:pimaricinolide synthase PimS1
VLTGLARAERQEVLLDLVRAEAAAALGATAESIGPRLPFSDAGLDPLVAAERSGTGRGQSRRH